MTTSLEHTMILRRRPTRRPGFTLVELLASMTIMTILMGAMTSVIVITSHAIPDSQNPVVKKIEAMDVVDQMAGELFYANAITEETVNAVTFTVADRGHGAAGPETIRYAWSGTGGDPLTRQYNGGTVVTVCDDVQQLNLIYDKRVEPLTGLPRVLMFVANVAALDVQETARKTAIEGWGFTVQPIADTSTQVEFDAAATNNDVVYIPDEVNALIVAPIIPNASIGIVNEFTALYDDIGVAQSGTLYLSTFLEIVDNTHEITSVFTLGGLRVFSTADELAISMSILAAGTQVLGGEIVGGNPSLLVLDVGKAMYGGGIANTRRVCLPWSGFKNFDFNNVTADGLTIMRRAIVWAAAPVVFTGARIDLQLTGVSQKAGTRVQMLNMPKVNAP